jgi:VanZ family protein
MKNFLKYNWPSILWAAFILVICLMPGRHIPRIHIPHFDKVVHTGIYMIFAILTYFGWTRQDSFQVLHHQTIIKILLLLSIYGLTVEVMQETLTADRHFELLDEVANITGTMIGTLIASQTSRQIIKKFN